MKLIRLVLLILTITILIDGFSGEFTSPTVFDFVKWGAYLLCIAAYYFYRRNHTCN